MKKGYLIIILIVILASVTIGYKFFYKKNTSGAVPCSREFYDAANKADVSLCELATEIPGYKNPYYNNACREWCIQEVAYIKGEPELCRLIKNFNDIAHMEGWDDPRETGSYLDHCYRHLAKKLNDVSLCNNVETEWAKNNCP